MPLVDPELDAFASDVRAANAETAARSREFARHLDPDGDVLAQVRSMMEPVGVFGQPLVAEATERTIPGPDGGEIALRLFVPDTVDAVYLAIRGGAFMMGNRAINDPTNWRMAQECKVAIVSPEYRLAPEHPYPSGHDDCEAVAVWLLEQGATELGSDRLLVGGESAGAHIAAVKLLRLRDRHDAMARVHGANLNGGVYDMVGTPSRTLPVPEHDILAAAPNNPVRGYFTGVDDLRDPDVSPLFADLRDLCPALFTVGTGDTLLDDSVFMARRWELAGNATELAVYPYGPHGVTGSPAEMGRRAQARVDAFVRRQARAGSPEAGPEMGPEAGKK